MQPHQPYLARPPINYKTARDNLLNYPGYSLDNKSNKHPFSLFQPLYQSIYHKLTKKWQRWIVRDTLFGVKNTSNQIKNLVMQKEYNKIRKLYAENLLAVLKEVARLTPYLNGKTIITADHGEMLGEDGMWTHTYDSDHPILRTVPWFEVK